MMSFHVLTNAIVVLTIDSLFVIRKSAISQRRIYRYGLALTVWIILSSIPYGIFHRTFG